MIFISNPKRKSIKNKRLDEFKRKNTFPGKGHPAYLCYKEGDNFYYIGITHDDIVTIDNKKYINIKLDKNPNPEDKKDAYFVPFVGKESKNSFGHRYSNYSFTQKDKKKVRNFFNKNKK